jgi:hypothetical protein
VTSLRLSGSVLHNPVVPLLVRVLLRNGCFFGSAVGQIRHNIINLHNTINARLNTRFQWLAILRIREIQFQVSAWRQGTLFFREFPQFKTKLSGRP